VTMCSLDLSTVVEFRVPTALPAREPGSILIDTAPCKTTIPSDSVGAPEWRCCSDTDCMCRVVRPPLRHSTTIADFARACPSTRSHGSNDSNSSSADVSRSHSRQSSHDNSINNNNNISNNNQNHHTNAVNVERHSGDDTPVLLPLPFKAVIDELSALRVSSTNTMLSPPPGDCSSDTVHDSPAVVTPVPPALYIDERDRCGTALVPIMVWVNEDAVADAAMTATQGRRRVPDNAIAARPTRAIRKFVFNRLPPPHLRTADLPTVS